MGSNPAGAKFLSLDGVVPTANASALGTYGFNFEATSQRRAGLVAPQLTLANTLISFAQKQAALPATTGNAFALPVFNGGASFAKANDARPVALGSRGKSSCKPSALQGNPIVP